MDKSPEMRMWMCLIATVAAVVAGNVLLSGPMAAAAQDDNAGAKATAKFDEIEVQRINVVEPDGKPRLVLSNKVKTPSAVINGTDLGNGGKRPGMTFYNSEGDESGGMGTDSGVADGTPWTSGLLAFDQYKQDQTLVLRYSEESGARGVGLGVQDRPEVNLDAMFEEYKKIQEMPPGKARDEAMEQFKKKYPSPQRVFVGKNRDKSAGVTLADAKGIPRLVLTVDQDGAPRIQFLNADGKVTKTIKG